MSEKKKDLSEVTIEKSRLYSSLRIGIVVSEWNTEVTSALAAGARTTLLEAGVKEENIIDIHVPGSFELPFGAQKLIETENPDAVICIGCVIQGETRHFEFISQAVSQGIMHVGLEYGRPVIFGVLTTDTIEQALARSGGAHGNKGVEAAATALAMAKLVLSRYSEEERL